MRVDDESWVCAVECVVQETPTVVLRTQFPIRELGGGNTKGERIDWLRTSPLVRDELTRVWTRHGNVLRAVQSAYLDMRAQLGITNEPGHDGLLLCNITAGPEIGKQVLLCGEGLGRENPIPIRCDTKDNVFHHLRVSLQ